MDPLKMYLGDIYTISVEPGRSSGRISVPCGVDSKGLPIGVQLIGDCFREKISSVPLMLTSRAGRMACAAV
ncbi:MAG: hypothetical protein ACLTSZ_01050 [Lachnospiraceae bacterium]